MFFIRAEGSQLPVLAIGDVEIPSGMAGIFDRVPMPHRGAQNDSQQDFFRSLLKQTAARWRPLVIPHYLNLGVKTLLIKVSLVPDSARVPPAGCRS
jgi:hypothetical protein